MKTPTDFQKRVYDAVSLVPCGKVTTYKLLADYLGCKSSQAIGQALKQNPLAPEVPCHRVIKSDFSLGGYQGEFGSVKQIMLESEGIIIKEGKLTDINQLFDFKSN